MISVSSAVLGSNGFLLVFSALRKMKELCILQFTRDLRILRFFLRSCCSLLASFEFSGGTGSVDECGKICFHYSVSVGLLNGPCSIVEILPSVMWTM